MLRLQNTDERNKRPKQMERHTMFMDQKTQQSKNVNPLQIYL